MGCDIHLFAEYRHKDSSKRYNDTWHNFGDHFNLGRHYGIFAAMAGVRSCENSPLMFAAPRGLPDNIGWRTNDAYWFYVCEEETDTSGWVSRAYAEKWVAENYSQWQTDEKKRVADPDAHSMSWLTPEEFRHAVEYVFPDGKEMTDNAEYKALAAALFSLENQGYECRVVFWFDN